MKLDSTRPYCIPRFLRSVLVKNYKLSNHLISHCSSTRVIGRQQTFGMLPVLESQFDCAATSTGHSNVLEHTRLRPFKHNGYWDSQWLVGTCGGMGLTAIGRSGLQNQVLPREQSSPWLG